jgi:hypothetical protein
MNTSERNRMEAEDVTKRAILVLGDREPDSICGRCNDSAYKLAENEHVHADGTPLCASRLEEIKRKGPERLRHYYAGEANGGMDVPRDYAEALGLTTVVFRKWYRRSDGNGVVAIFPQDIDPATGMTQMFEHVGQHGRGDYVGTISRTRAAKPAEYADLLKELESPPYTYWLDVKRRAPGPKRRRG